MHHPLPPKPEDIAFTATDPGKFVLMHMIWLNGNEIEEVLFVFMIKRHNS
jgi:hypothetical protein